MQLLLLLTGCIEYGELIGGNDSNRDPAGDISYLQEAPDCLVGPGDYSSDEMSATGDFYTDLADLVPETVLNENAEENLRQIETALISATDTAQQELARILSENDISTASFNNGSYPAHAAISINQFDGGWADTLEVNSYNPLTILGESLEFDATPTSSNMLTFATGAAELTGINCYAEENLGRDSGSVKASAFLIEGGVILAGWEFKVVKDPNTGQHSLYINVWENGTQTVDSGELLLSSADSTRVLNALNTIGQDVSQASLNGAQESANADSDLEYRDGFVLNPELF